MNATHLKTALDFEAPSDVRIEALEKLTDPNVVATIASAIPEADEPVAAAMTALVERLDATTVLTRDLTSPDPQVRRTAAHALTLLKDRGALAALITAMSDAEASVREEVVSALHALADPAAVDALRAALCADPCVEVRMAAAQALGAIDTPEALDVLTRAEVEEDDDFVSLLIERSIRLHEDRRW